jgi:HK97 family phage portal protein
MALEFAKNRLRKWLGVDQLSQQYGSSWSWLFGNGNRSSSGITVTPESAMQLATVYACVRVLSESLANMPLLLYQRVGDRKIRASGNPLFELLRSRPNNWQTAQEFWEMCVGHVCLRGNFYAHILPGTRGAVDQLIPMHPDRMQKVELLPNYTLRYTYLNDRGQPEVYLQDELFHVRGLSSDGFVGMSAISAAKNAIGLAISTENHGSTLFKNGARPGVVFERTANITQDAADKFKMSWDSMHAGSENAHRTAVLPLGLKPVELGLNNDDAQFLDTRKYQRSEICGVFRVPPHKIADLDRATFSNIEEQNIAFVQETLMPWARRIEQAVNRDLVTEQDTYFAEFLFEGLLRGNASSRSAFYTSLWNMGVLTVNEIRAMENMNPIGEEGDKRFVQLNMTTLEKAGEDPVEQPALPSEPSEPAEDSVEDEAEDDAEESQDMSAAVEPAWAVYYEALGKFTRWEVDAVNRLAAKGGQFLAGVEKFYAEHSQRVAKGMYQPMLLLSSLGELDDDINVLPILEARKASVIEASGNVTAESLKAAIETLTATWNAPLTETKGAA